MKKRLLFISLVFSALFSGFLFAKDDERGFVAVEKKKILVGFRKKQVVPEYLKKHFPAVEIKRAKRAKKKMKVDNRVPLRVPKMKDPVDVKVDSFKSFLDSRTVDYNGVLLSEVIATRLFEQAVEDMKEAALKLHLQKKSDFLPVQVRTASEVAKNRAFFRGIKVFSSEESGTRSYYSLLRFQEFITARKKALVNLETVHVNGDKDLDRWNVLVSIQRKLNKVWKKIAEFHENYQSGLKEDYENFCKEQEKALAQEGAEEKDKKRNIDVFSYMSKINGFASKRRSELKEQIRLWVSTHSDLPNLEKRYNKHYKFNLFFPKY